MADNTDTEFGQHYSEQGLWRKLGASALKAGKKAVGHALELYYALEESSTPSWAKGVIIGALGYFILPADAIPDMLPGIGYTDDLGVLAAALAAVEMHITPEIKAKAANKLAQWFGTENRPPAT
jgi:uncharacterized membrane protein YkvA (DUF1232 family)